MINKAINLIKSSTDSMAWIDRKGGIVYNAKRAVETEDGIKEQRFPVSTGVLPVDCFESGTYLDLVPDSKYYSVSYFEQLTDVTTVPAPIARRHKMLNMSVSVRFFVWLNLNKIGINDPTLTADFKMQSLNRLDRTHTGTSEVQNIQINNLQIESKDNTIKSMEQYTFDNLQRLVTFPYDVFSIKFDLSWRTPVNCAEDVELGFEIEC